MREQPCLGCGVFEPRLATAEDEICGLDELSHDGDDGDSQGLAALNEALGEGFQTGIAALGAENSHLPIRRRERAMERFRRMKTLQKFAAVHGTVHNLFSQERHLISRDLYRERRSAALAEWRAVMG